MEKLKAILTKDLNMTKVCAKLNLNGKKRGGERKFAQTSQQNC
jgi:hypothetical protein